jgi:hypothetical protein
MMSRILLFWNTGCFITLEAELTDTQTKPFIIQKGLQGIIGTPKSVKKLKSGALLI